MTVEEQRPARTGRGRRAAVVAGRTTAGVVTAAIAAGVAFAATLIVPPTWSVTAPSVVASPTAAPQQLACPGGLLRLGNDAGEGASTATPLGTPRTAWAADTAVDHRSVATTNAGTTGTAAAAAIGTVATAEDGVPAATGIQAELVDGNVTGLSLTACTAPASEQWVVAGATTLGRTSLLLLTNPSAVEARVDIELYGEDGQVAAAGLEGIRLAPDEQRVVPLNGFAVDLAAPVVRVVASGGRVVAAIQQSIIRTLTPGGVEMVSAQHPQPTLVIPGVRVQERAELAPIDTSQLDHPDISPVLRLFAPGPTEVSATVALIPQGASLDDALAARDEPETDDPSDAHADHDHDGDGIRVPEPRSFDLALTPGIVTEYPIEQVAAGDYTVVVIAAQDVVGAVRTSILEPAATKEAAPRVDFAWATPAAPLSGHAVLTLPRLVDRTGGVPGLTGAAATEADAGTTTGAAATEAGASAQPAAGATVPTGQGSLPGYLLWVVNPGTETAEVTLSVGGIPQQLTIGPGTAQWVQVAADTQLTLDGTAGLAAAVLAVGDGLLAQTALQPPAQLASDVTVHF